MLSLLNNFFIRRLLAPVVAGTSTQTSSSVDMAGCQTCCFVVGLGTLTSTNETTIKIQGSDDNSTWVDLSGASFVVYDTEDNKLAIAEIVRPVHRYVRVSIARATANAVIDLVLAIVGVHLRNRPVTQNTTDTTAYGNKMYVSPAAA